MIRVNTSIDLPNPDVFTSVANVFYGSFKVVSGATLFVAGTAADVTGIGALLGVSAQTLGAYQFITGVARLYRAIGQAEGAVCEPSLSKTPLHFGEDLLLNLAPAGGGLTDVLGGLP